MRRTIGRTALAWAVLFAVSKAVDAQVPTADVVGIMRQDGIAVPLFEWRNDSWTHVRGDSLRLISSVIVRDSLGRADSFPTLDTVTVNDGYDFRGWQTEMPEPEDMRLHWYPVPRVGYMVTGLEGDAPFRPRSLSEGDPLHTAIVRAVEEASDTVLPPVVVDAWEATLGTTEVVFFEVGSGPGGVGCLSSIDSGWYRVEWDAPIISTHQFGDCEKGVLHRAPWALLRRADGISAYVTVRGWEGADYELWSLEDGASRAVCGPVGRGSRPLGDLMSRLVLEEYGVTLSEAR